MANMLTITN